jgi:hypothetical protein
MDCQASPRLADGDGVILSVPLPADSDPYAAQLNPRRALTGRQCIGCGYAEEIGVPNSAQTAVTAEVWMIGGRAPISEYVCQA